MTIINGIDLSTLVEKDTFTYPEVVKDRVVHIDGDFVAYMVSYDDNLPLEQMRLKCAAKIERIRALAGAERLMIHLTHKDSDKGNRHNIALVREYQAQRKKIKPKYLHLMRAYMHDTFGGINHLNCEADDGMSIAQYDAIARGDRNLSIIATKDKDLLMVPGLQLDWDTGFISDTYPDDDFGWVDLCRDKSTPKIRGRGWKMLWAQLLTGDAADNISGLPLVCDPTYLPKGKPKACGPVLAHEILDPITTNKEAFETVRELYRLCHEHKPFTNYRDGTEIPYGLAMLSDAKLLWMRRVNEEDDVLNWMKETCV